MSRTVEAARRAKQSENVPLRGSQALQEPNRSRSDSGSFARTSSPAGAAFARRSASPAQHSSARSSSEYAFGLPSGLPSTAACTAAGSAPQPRQPPSPTGSLPNLNGLQAQHALLQQQSLASQPGAGGVDTNGGGGGFGGGPEQRGPPPPIAEERETSTGRYRRSPRVACPCCSAGSALDSRWRVTTWASAQTGRKAPCFCCPAVGLPYAACSWLAQASPGILNSVFCISHVLRKSTELYCYSVAFPCSLEQRMDANVTDLLSGDNDGGAGAKPHTNGPSTSHLQPQHEESHLKKWGDGGGSRPNATGHAIATQAL